jgi:hypothetical protein
MNKEDGVCSPNSASIVKTKKIWERQFFWLTFYILATSELKWSKVFDMLFQKHRNSLHGTGYPGCSLDILVSKP